MYDGDGESIRDDTFSREFDRQVDELSDWNERILDDDWNAVRKRADWVAAVGFGLYPLILRNEERFRQACKKRRIGRHGRSEIMLMRCLVKNPGNWKRQSGRRWANAMLFGLERGSDREAISHAIVEVGGVIPAHDLYLKQHPERRQAHRPKRTPTQPAPETPARSETPAPIADEMVRVPAAKYAKLEQGVKRLDELEADLKQFIGKHGLSYAAEPPLRCIADHVERVLGERNFWKGKFDRYKAENPTQQDLLAELIVENPGHAPKELDPAARYKLFNIAEGVFHPRSNVGEALMRLRGYQRIAPGVDLDTLYERTKSQAEIKSLKRKLDRSERENDRLNAEILKLKRDNQNRAADSGRAKQGSTHRKAKMEPV